MSNSWHGGKGDKSRISDYKKFYENFDNIFRKEKPHKAYCEHCGKTLEILDEKCHCLEVDAPIRNNNEALHI